MSEHAAASDTSRDPLDLLQRGEERLLGPLSEGSAGRLQLALEAGRLGIGEWILATDEARYSPRLEEIFGFTPGTFPTTFDAVRAAFHPDDRDRVLRTLAEAIELKRPFLDLETRIVRPDGSVRWVESRAQLLLDGDGRPERVLGVCADITERKQVEQEVGEQAQLLQMLDEAVWELDAELRITRWNKAAERMYGYTAAEAIGRHASELLRPTISPEASAANLKRLADGEIVRVEVELHKKDGSAVWSNITAVATGHRDGALASIISVNRDITDRKRAEERLHLALAEAEEATRLKDEFIATVSDELRWKAAVVEHADDAIIGKDLDGIIVSWNPGAQALYGYTAAEMIGRHISVLAPPERRHESGEILDKIRRGEIVHRYDTERVTKESDRVDVSVTASGVRDSTGTLIGASVIARDIGEQKHAERRLRSLLEAAPDATVIVDASGRIVMVNAQVERLLGYRRHELLDQPVETLVPGHARRMHIAHRHDYARSARPRPMGAGLELTAVRNDGTEVPVEISLSPVATEEGTLVVAAIRDVTDRRQREKQLREANEELRVFRRVMEESPYGMSVIDRRYIYRLVNRAFAAMHHHAPEGIVGRTVAELLGESLFQDVVRSRLDRCFAGEFVGFEATFDYPSGPLFVEVRYYPLRQDESVEYAVAVWHDLTEQKRMTEQLRLSEAQLKHAQELSHMGSYELGVPPGPSTRWSEQVFTILGRNPEDGPLPTSDYISKVVHPDDRSYVADVFGRSVRELTPYQMEYRIVRPDGATRVVHSVGEPLKVGDGTSVKVVGTLQDVTDRRRAEDALRQAEARLAHISRVATMGELASSIAHEINQPLAAIVNDGAACLRWLQSRPPALEEAKESVQHIIGDANRASHVIARIRTLLAKKPSVKAAFDVNELVRETVALVKGEIVRVGATLRSELSSGVPPVMGDRIQVQQVLINLLMNALEAMSRTKSRSRELTVTSGRGASSTVVIAVRDSGEGIPADLRDRIFDAFFTTKRDGLGMGLAISRSIIEEHGGQLWALDHEGAGATVQFTIPVAEEES
jgi:PAS domain S-box-containing protein